MIMNKEAHTKAIGTEPYDKSYGLGYQVHHGDWSPFPRVNHLRKTFLDREYYIDVQRLRLVTESYKAHENESQIMKCAYAFQNVLLNTDLYIYDEDLIVGEICAPAKASPIYPEFSVKWIINEIKNFPFEEREHDQFYVRNDQERQEILELCEWWRGKTVEDYVDDNLTREETKGSEDGARVFQTNLYHYAGVGHLAIDYPRLMTLGFGGIRKEAEEKFSTEKDPAKREFYKAVIIMYEAVSKYVIRYADLAEEKAAVEKNPGRKAELTRLSEVCRAIAEDAPKGFCEALQLFQIATSLIVVEGNGHSISYGRMDQWLYPFYENDIKNGAITKEFALELLEVIYVKLNNPTKLKDRGSMALRNGRGFGGESLTIGGTDTEGKDATNDLTMLMLEASAHTRMMNPWVCVRIHENTPHELLCKAVECIRAGYGHPKLFNDGPAVKAMLRKGMSLEEARDYCVVGCVEIDLPGREYGWHDAAYVNTAKMMELVINGGKCLDSDDRIGPDTGSLDSFNSFDEVLESFKAQVNYWADRMCASLSVIEKGHQSLKPLPFVSAFFPDCMEKGIDLNAGGARYNGIGPQASGIATCADSLSAIKQLVFEEKVCTGAEFLKALKNNYEGYEWLYALTNSTKVHHYGNDDDYADDLFRFVFETYCKSLEGRETVRKGGHYHPGVYSVNANVAMGVNTNATPDGRKKGEAISENMGPVHNSTGSHDIAGPTALANSVAKADHSLATNGTLMNMRFPQDAVSGQRGRDNLMYFIREYMAKGPMHIQFNIMSAETMRQAQKHPEDYKDMLVRVAGYSAYFVELGTRLQTDLIQRTELHF